MRGGKHARFAALLEECFSATELAYIRDTSYGASALDMVRKAVRYAALLQKREKEEQRWPGDVVQRLMREERDRQRWTRAIKALEEKRKAATAVTPPSSAYSGARWGLTSLTRSEQA